MALPTTWFVEQVAGSENNGLWDSLTLPWQLQYPWHNAIGRTVWTTYQGQ